MEHDIFTRQKERASAFWKAYFAKFRRRVEDNEQSETRPALLSATPASPLPFPDRRRPRAQRFTLHR
jgi:hypothetical protein